MTSRAGQRSPLQKGATPTRGKRAGVTKKVVISLDHKKHTRDSKTEQARFQRRMKVLATWTALLAALAALVTALAELIHSLVKLLP